MDFFGEFLRLFFLKISFKFSFLVVCKVHLLSAQRAVSSYARVASSVQFKIWENLHEFHGDCGQIVIFNSFAEEDWHATQGDAYCRLSWMDVLSLTHLALNRIGMSLRAWQLLPQFIYTNYGYTLVN